MGKLIRFILLVLLIAGIGYAAICVYGNTCAGPGGSNVNLPDLTKAPYAVMIENTGRVLFVDDSFEVFGSEVGKRKYLLHGYWDIEGQKFIYRNLELLLDEQTFGTITVTRR